MIAATIATVFACDVVSFTVIQTCKSHVAKHIDVNRVVRSAELRVVAAQHAVRQYKDVIAKRYVK